MGDGIQRIGGFLSGERTIGQLLTVETAIVVENILPKHLYKLSQGRLSRFNHFTSNLVRIDDANALVTEHRRHGRFTAADPACQANE